MYNYHHTVKTKLFLPLYLETLIILNLKKTVYTCILIFQKSQIVKKSKSQKSKI